jgi:hypothetical protein
MATMNFTRAEDQPAAEHGQVGGATVDPSPLVGTWLNTDKQTRGIAKLVLTQKDGALKVRAFGACEPALCDWGEVAGVAFSSGVGSSEGMAFTALFDFGFMETLLAVYLKGGILVLDSFNTFRDDSGRSNYFSREFFHS